MDGMKLTPDLVTAQSFLDILEPEGVFSFQTFDDNKDRKARSLARVFHGTLAEHSDALTSLQQQGAGVFVMVNEGDGNGRAAENVIRVRAHFVDLDGAPLEPLLRSAQPAHIIVESSPGRWHGYWLDEGCDLADFKLHQRELAAAFGGDKTVCDLCRVMRLPGYWHLKGSTPHMTRLHEIAGIGHRV